jgi:hypothetical protein
VAGRARPIRGQRAGARRAGQQIAEVVHV